MNRAEKLYITFGKHQIKSLGSSQLNLRRYEIKWKRDMSTVHNRIEDALILWDRGRQCGAFLMALIAIAATARRRYPKDKDMTDRNAFEQFIRDCHSVRMKIEYRGESHSVEHIFYKWLRCQLVHEGTLPLDIQFMQDTELGLMSVRAGGAPEYILKIGTGWFFHMINSVAQAPENADGL